MANEKLDISEVVYRPIARSIEEITAKYEKDNDIARLIVQLDDLARMIRVIPDIANSPENRLASFLAWHFITTSSVSLFQDKSNDWFKSNEDQVKEICELLMIYLSKIKQSLELQAYDDLIEATKDYFFGFMNIWKDLSFKQ